MGCGRFEGGPRPRNRLRFETVRSTPSSLTATASPRQPTGPGSAPSASLLPGRWAGHRRPNRGRPPKRRGRHRRRPRPRRPRPAGRARVGRDHQLVGLLTHDECSPSINDWPNSSTRAARPPRDAASTLRTAQQLQRVAAGLRIAALAGACDEGCGCTESGHRESRARWAPGSINGSAHGTSCSSRQPAHVHRGKGRRRPASATAPPSVGRVGVLDWSAP